ncbi:dapdiamide synthesis protein DdaC [Hydra vulgaris]|uniref:Dapdiamide synthesis protein DdaC n=1 Tax=Hydra vulgaris TaxID=6087 RepID=A0ABM4C3C8_HYDVU
MITTKVFQSLRYFSFIKCNTLEVFTKAKGSVVKNRPFLAGSTELGMPEYLSHHSNKNLLVVRCNDTNNVTLCDAANKFRFYIDENLSQYSAILFKKLPIKTESDFNLFMSHSGYKSIAYVAGNASRSKLVGEVYETSNEPADLSIEPHNEMSYHVTFPRKIFFCCLTPPLTDGETPIAFNRDIIQHIDKNYLEKVEKRGIRYIRNHGNKKLTKYMTWQDIYSTSSHQEVETKLRKFNNNWKWNENETLTTWYTTSPIIYHPETGEKIWFNQLSAAHNTYYKCHPDYIGKQLKDHEYFLHTTYGDGEEFEPELVQHIRNVAWNASIGFQWEKGDVIVLDNLLAQHGRLSYTGKRKIVVSLTDILKREAVQPNS